MRAALAALDPAPYPDRNCHRLRRLIATRYGCDPGQILAGNSANELIHLVARAMLRPGDVSLVVEPTFGEYAHASRLAGARVVRRCYSGHERMPHDARGDLISARSYGTRRSAGWGCSVRFGDLSH